MEEEFRVKVGPKGEIILPKGFRKRTGLKSKNIRIIITVRGILLIPEEHYIVDLMQGLSSIKRQYSKEDYYTEILWRGI